MIDRNSPLSIEKLRIDERLKKIEVFMIEEKFIRDRNIDIMNQVSKRILSLEENVNGRGREKGIQDRVIDLEYKEDKRTKVAEGMLKVAVGSLTLAIGSCMLWLGKLIWSSVGK